MNKNSKIYVAGHRGLVGSAVCRKLIAQKHTNIVTADKISLDLRDYNSVKSFFDEHRPEYVFLAAAKVGGIAYNSTHPADFIRDNLFIQNNVIDCAYKYGVKKLCFLGSACIYPKNAAVPVQESSLLSDYLESTNEAYAVAKIAGYYMCKKYTEQYGFNTISVMPANLYGINDNFHLDKCHVIPAIIKKVLIAKNNNRRSVECYGDGTATREFLYCDDLADALYFLMNHYHDPEIINIGTGLEISIRELVNTVSNIIGYSGEIIWNTEYPNGTPRRFLDISRLSDLGWKAKTSLKIGLQTTIDWYMNTQRPHVSNISSVSSS